MQYGINCSSDSYSYYSENTTFLSLLLLPMITNENELNSPIVLVEKLNSRRSEIQSFIPRLDSDNFVNMINLPDDIPSFLIKPSYTSIGIDWFQFRVNFR